MAGVRLKSEIQQNIDSRKLLKECKISFSRSSGKGGQNVNKVETKAELKFSIDESLILREKIKSRLKEKLKNRIDNNGNIRIYSQSSRTQLSNKKKVIEKFIKLLEHSLSEDKIRIKTIRSYSSKEKILREKKIISSKKKLRQKKDFHDD